MHDPETLAFTIGRYIDVWHIDPSGDHGHPCSTGPRWKWHIHHWRIRSIPLINLRRRLLTRCTWCGGKDRKRDRVNHSNGGRHRAPWWKGETGLFHGDCISINSAHRTCLCEHPLPERESHGTCGLCGKFRPFGLTPERLTAERALAAIPVGHRAA